MERYKILIMKLLLIILIPLSLLVSVYSTMQLTYTIIKINKKIPTIKSILIYDDFELSEELRERGIKGDEKICGDIGNVLIHIKLNFGIDQDRGF